jgi:hypothetical protein
MIKNRVCTTISAKHWGLLMKYREKFLTQQKVLEAALESLENNSKQSNQNSALSSEEHDFLLARGAMKSACIIHRDIVKALIDTSDIERIGEIINNQNPMEHLIAHYYQKPLQKCNLKEVLDGIIFFTRSGNVSDIINYTDEGNYYFLKIIHSLNHNCSKIFKIIIENILKTYGAKTETETSEKTVFIKIYKNFAV